ncbi:MAG: neuromedin U [Gammaproteobacteria bacterium]|nr:neuromedin U [Gammaproteobacteria bacterium]
MIRVYLGIVFLLCSTAVFALDANSELAKKAQNPVENMISIPFDNNWNYNFTPANRTQYVLNMKPVIPFELTPSWNLILRTIIPVLHQPELNPPFNGNRSGLGDINPSLFLSPGKPREIIWGLGPTMIFPTATNQQLGQGKYSLGPSLVILSMPKQWVLGILTYNVWSVGGQSNRHSVNQFTLQYFINYNFPHGWYITTQPVITANWTATSKNRWTVPFGIGVGRVFNIAKQAVNVSIQAYDNVKKPQIAGSNWQAELNFSFLFPKR